MSLMLFIISGTNPSGFYVQEADAKPSAKRRQSSQSTARKSRKRRRAKKRKKQRFQKYIVARGETLKQIAGATGVSVKELKRINRIKGNRVRTGKVLKYPGKAIRSESIGQTNNGKLRGALSIDADGDFRGIGFALHKRRRHIWGVPELVRSIKKCGKYYRKLVGPKRGHPIAIGDLSKRHGGPFPPHVSHQSGRDVDVGIIRKKAPKPGVFIHTKPKDMNLYAQWVVVKCFLDDPQTSMIFIEHSLVKALKGEVKRLYKKRRSKLRKYLSFFPGGKRKVIYGDNDHRSHMHVRINCPKRHRRCRGR